MVHLDAGKDGKMLSSLFDSKLADPRCTKAADINPVQEQRDEFKKFTKEAFLNNCKTTAVKWMSGKAIKGEQFKSLICEFWRALAILFVLLNPN